METRTYSELRAILDGVVIARSYSAQKLRELDPDEVEFHNFYNGAIVSFERVTVTVEYEMVPTIGYGHAGKLREQVKSRNEDVQSVEVLRFQKRKGQYGWIPA